MIEFHYEISFTLDDETQYVDWISRVIASEGGLTGAVAYIFCSDEQLFEMNKKHLSHDMFTDIITFDYAHGKLIAGDIFVSVDRVIDNAKTFKVTFEDELLRVMAHGLLHLFGYNDKTESERAQMRTRENEKIKLFHVEH